MLFAARNEKLQNLKKGVERRRHERVELSCCMMLTIGGKAHHCQLRNVSESGAFAALPHHGYGADPLQDSSAVQVGDEGLCEFFYQGHEFKAQCSVVRMYDNSVGLAFFALKEHQTRAIQAIVDIALRHQHNRPANKS